MAESDENTKVEGTVDQIVYQNAESHYTVARLAMDKGDIVTIVGVMPQVQSGARLRVTGKYVHDSRYGEQLKVERYEPVAPSTAHGIQRYLGSGLIPTIGAELAKRIVDHFGADTLRVIENEPKRLQEIEGIGRVRAGRIAEGVQGQRAVQDVMVFLQGHGVSAAFAVRIMERYGANAAAVVRENPYRLALDIWGIGFKIADSIARNLGIEKTSGTRAEAGLLHVLGELTEDGHVHVPEPDLLARTREALDVGDEIILPALDRVVGAGRIVRERLGDRDCLSLRTLWEAEVRAAQRMVRIVEEPAPRAADIEKHVEELQERLGFALAPEQRLAVTRAISDKLTVITGGPGVGKTTIVRGVLDLATRAGWTVALAAPTGRAAKRMSEATGQPASTVHRLLEFQPQGASFMRNESDPLEADMVIVDEASMLDISLCAHLVAAVPPEARLVLVGDVDQLPSVGPGRVLADVIASGVASVVRLTEVFRQAAQSAIIRSAHRVNRGEPPELSNQEGSDFFFIEKEDPAAALETVCKVVTERIPERFGLDPINDVQVLVPMHRGEVGATNLNSVLQERLNPHRPAVRELRRQSRMFRVGDKVMQIRNDYERDVFNGDVGRIVDMIGEDRPEVIVEIDGRSIRYETGQLDQLVHAFAVTVHKSQGSEYPAIVLPLVTQHFMMLQRNLLYTAITRGKRLVVVVGSRKALSLAVRNDDTKQRWSWLAERLRRAAAGPLPLPGT